MATFLGSAADDGNANIQTATSNVFDSSGANLLVVHVTYYKSGTATPTVTDSKSNTWQALTPTNVDGGEWHQRWYYVIGGTVGTSHTVQAAFGEDAYPAIGVMYFSGVASFDAESAGGEGGASGAITSVQGGTITPSADNALVISGVTWEPEEAISIDGGFTEQQEQPNTTGNTVGNAMAYLIQTTAAAANPTWTWTTGGQGAARNAAFLSSVGGGGNDLSVSLGEPVIGGSTF